MCSRPEGGDTALSPAEGGERAHHVLVGGSGPHLVLRAGTDCGEMSGPKAGPSTRQSLDEALRDLSAAMHRDLSEKQALCYALSFPPTKLELCSTRPEGTDSFIFEFPHPDARLGFEQAFDEAKRKLGKPGPCWCPLSSTSRQWAAPCRGVGDQEPEIPRPLCPVLQSLLRGRVA